MGRRLRISANYDANTSTPKMKLVTINSAGTTHAIVSSGLNGSRAQGDIVLVPSTSVGYHIAMAGYIPNGGVGDDKAIAVGLFDSSGALFGAFAGGAGYQGKDVVALPDGDLIIATTRDKTSKDDFGQIQMFRFHHFNLLGYKARLIEFVFVETGRLMTDADFYPHGNGSRGGDTKL